MVSTNTGDLASRLWRLKEMDVVSERCKFNDLSGNSSDEDDDSKMIIDSDDERKSRQDEYMDCDDKDSNKKPELVKPTQSYIALIATAILKSKEKRLVLSDIYKYIMEKFSYFQSQDKSWRNSIRHNLSLNECFIKVGRSEHGKGHYWAIHPANYDDFSQGDFRRRRARRRVRRSFLDTHPYNGYPLRLYTNFPRAKYVHEYSSPYKQLELTRRQIYPMVYESNYFHPRKINVLSSPPYLRKTYENKKRSHDTEQIVYKNETQNDNEFTTRGKINKSDINIIVEDSSIKSTPPAPTKPRKHTSFSIDSILGNKLETKKVEKQVIPESIVTKYTDKHCSIHTDNKPVKHFPYHDTQHHRYRTSIRDNVPRKLSPEPMNVKRFIY